MTTIFFWRVIILGFIFAGGSERRIKIFSSTAATLFSSTEDELTKTLTFKFIILKI